MDEEIRCAFQFPTLIERRYIAFFKGGCAALVASRGLDLAHPAPPPFAPFCFLMTETSPTPTTEAPESTARLIFRHGMVVVVCAGMVGILWDAHGRRSGITMTTVSTLLIYLALLTLHVNAYFLPKERWIHRTAMTLTALLMTGSILLNHFAK